jgi:16S rRNA (cytosine1402-N4)-methyltransferase
MDTSYHVPVLLTQALDVLVTDERGIYVDGTVGGGGHAEQICLRLTGNGTLYCFDRDEEALRHAGARLARFGTRVRFVHADYASLVTELSGRGVDRIQGLLLDLGVSSHQLDDESRGFSFRGDETLDMRMDSSGTRTAKDIVNSYSDERLAEVLWKFGEERNSRRIARQIVKARPIETTGELRRVVEKAGGQPVKTLARVFQAIRIEVNNELGSLRRGLEDATSMLASGGRMVVIAYHSLEDRIVKEFFKSASATVQPSGHKLVPDKTLSPALRMVTRKPVTPAPDEIARNPRARSAKMRVAERL